MSTTRAFNMNKKRLKTKEILVVFTSDYPEVLSPFVQKAIYVNNPG